jgi:hypothetical protein
MRSARICEGMARILGSSAHRKRCPCRTPAVQQEGADLIDDAGALADQSLAHPVQRLEVELIGSLRRHGLRRRPLYRLGDRLRVAEVVPLSL